MNNQKIIDELMAIAERLEYISICNVLKNYASGALEIAASSVYHLVDLIRVADFDKPTNSADLCRKNNWTFGTMLEGDDGSGPERIVITAIGRITVLAKQADDYTGDTEHAWDLRLRDWKRVAE